MNDILLTTKRILRKLGGDKISSKVFTYDGREDAEFNDLNGMRIVTLSEDVYDLHNVAKIKCVLSTTGQTFEFAKGECTFVDNYRGSGLDALTVTMFGETVPVVLAYKYEEGGLYGYAQETVGYCSYVEFAETIHPIDPKYIPAMDSITLNGADGKQYKLIVSGGALNISEVV